MRVRSCRVNHMDEPLGFYLGEATFSWVVDDEGWVARGRIESRLVVRSEAGAVCDTGWAELDCAATRPELALLPRTRYTWQVSVRDEAGHVAEGGEHSFETGKMGEPWQAAWLCCDEADGRHPTLARTITTRPGAPLAAARAYVCGLGLYEVEVDGRLASTEHLAPGTCAYDKWLQVATIDLTGALAEPGEHDLRVTLGDGWYKGRFGFIPTRGGYYGDDWSLIAEVHLTYADGSHEVVATDESWQVGRSNVTFSNIYDGEHVDATLPAVEPMPARLLDPEEAAARTARLRDRLSPAVSDHELFSPTLIETPAGEKVLDLGQNIAGGFRMRVHEPAGATVRLQFGEVLQEGNFYRDNLRSAEAAYTFVSDGEPHVLRPRFTYYGYRYVKVEGVRNLRPSDFEGVAWYSDIDTGAGRMRTANPLVNRLVENTRWGMRDNFVDTPTDCPQRDERMGWTGDAQIFSPTACYLGKPYAFFHKYLHDMALEQRALGGAMPMVVPSFGVVGAGSVWGDATVVIPWNLYLFSGDDAVLREHWGAMRAWMDHVAALDGDDHGWPSAAAHLGDWLALDSRPGKDERFGATDEGFVAYVAYLQSARIMARAAAVLGEGADKARFEALAEALLSWIRSEYFSPNGRCCIDTQTAHALTIVHGLADARRAGRALHDLVQAMGGQLTCGFVGTPVICEALCRTGYERDAYQLLLRERQPGWLNPVIQGATTIWERWDSLDEDGRITGTSMNSLNHYAYGSICAWLFGWAAGLRPDAAAPGFALATVAPHVDWRLGELEATYESAHGTWRVAWSVSGERSVHLELVVPLGCTARVRLPHAPGGAARTLAASGGVTVEVTTGDAAGEAVVELPHGSYAVDYEATIALRHALSLDSPLADVLESSAAVAAIEGIVPHLHLTMTPMELHATPLRDLPWQDLCHRPLSTEQQQAIAAALEGLSDRRYGDED